MERQSFVFEPEPGRDYVRRGDLYVSTGDIVEIEGLGEIDQEILDGFKHLDNSRVQEVEIKIGGNSMRIENGNGFKLVTGREGLRRFEGFDVLENFKVEWAELVSTRMHLIAGGIVNDCLPVILDKYHGFRAHPPKKVISLGREYLAKEIGLGIEKYPADRLVDAEQFDNRFEREMFVRDVCEIVRVRLLRLLQEREIEGINLKMIKTEQGLSLFACSSGGILST